MKRTRLMMGCAILCVAFSSLLIAQANPLIGSWKLNTEKSKYPAGMAPKSMMRTVAADGDNVKYSYEGMGPDGAAEKFEFSVKYDGKDYEVTGNGAPYGADHIVIKKVNSHMFSAILKKDGKQVGTSSVTVSHDGKTTTIASKGMDAKGNPMKSTSVYDKQ